MAEPAPPSSSRKKFPTWGYLAIAGGAVVLYYLYSRNQAASSAAAQQQAAGSALAPVAAGSYGTGGLTAGDLANLLPQLQNMSGVASTAAPYTPPVGETLTGAGYAPANPNAVVGSASGMNFQEVGNWTAAQSLIAAGQTLYYQPSPGVFAPAAQGGHLIIPPNTNTPLFISQGQSA